MPITKHLIILSLAITCCASTPALWAEPLHAGFLYDEFDLTLAPGHRKEAVGPFFYSEQKEDQHTWAFPMLTLAHTEDSTIGYEEFDFAYPLLTLDRFGTEYRFQILQVFSFAGGNDQKEDKARRFTLFPFYFQQRSPDPSENYTALLPFYGTLKNRLFRDQIDFVLLPLYVKTRKRDLVSIDTPYPFFCRTYGDGVRGWQLWPFVGHEHKEITQRTNVWGDLETIAGHDNRFVLWPFFLESRTETGTTNAAWSQTLIPFYSVTRSQPRDSTSYLWPIGVTHTIDREHKYTEWDAPWPLVVFARGEDKHTDRVWPFYSHARNKYLESDWYLWLVYKYNRIHSDPLDRERTRILYFLYSDVTEKNTETGEALHRRDFWPLFTYRRDFKGNARLQILSIIEPVLPTNKSIERDYSFIYALWRSESNPTDVATSQSLLWNLYRRETKLDTRKISLLFGLFQYHSSPEGRKWRICYIPLGKSDGPSQKPVTQR